MCDFTLHAMDWDSVAPLMCEFRASAHAAGLLRDGEPITDHEDSQSRHALALMHCKVIGAARLTRQGKIERMIVLPHECRGRIEAALIEVLRNYACAHLRPAFDPA